VEQHLLELYCGSFTGTCTDRRENAKKVFETRMADSKLVSCSKICTVKVSTYLGYPSENNCAHRSTYKHFYFS